MSLDCAAVARRGALHAPRRTTPTRTSSNTVKLSVAHAALLCGLCPPLLLPVRTRSHVCLVAGWLVGRLRAASAACRVGPVRRADLVRAPRLRPGETAHEHLQSKEGRREEQRERGGAKRGNRQ